MDLSQKLAELDAHLLRWFRKLVHYLWLSLEYVGSAILWIPRAIGFVLLWLVRAIVYLPAMRLGSLVRYGLLGFMGVCVLVILLALGLALYPNTQLVPLRPVEQYVYLDQWSTPNDLRGSQEGLEGSKRQTYYYTAQGTDLKNLRYDWLTNLEMPFEKRLLADPANMRRFGFLVDAMPSKMNPDQLPVGFSKHYDYDLREDVLDLTCATCHTGQLDIDSPSNSGKLYTVRIDGGQAMHAFTAVAVGHFIPTLLESMTSTYLNPWKFNRFARRVLKDHYAEGKGQLHGQLWATIKLFGAQAWTDTRYHLYPTVEGFGRTDALARIGNTVFGENLDAKNYKVGDAPVSYPPVWNAWKMDWVQYNASVRQPLARNLGESLGVGAKMDLVAAHGFPIPKEQRYWTSSRFLDLKTIEKVLWDLQPPKWPEGCFGPINQQLATEGKALFGQRCQVCHGPFVADKNLAAYIAPDKDPDAKREQPVWVVKAIPLQEIGTDPTAALNFVNKKLDLSKLGVTTEEARAQLGAKLDIDLQAQKKYLAAEIKDACNQRQAKATEQTDLACQKSVENYKCGAVTTAYTAYTVYPASACANYKVKDLECRWNDVNENGPGRNQATLDSLDVKSMNTGVGLSLIGQYMRDYFYEVTLHTDPDRKPKGTRAVEGQAEKEPSSMVADTRGGMVPDSPPPPQPPSAGQTTADICSNLPLVPPEKPSSPPGACNDSNDKECLKAQAKWWQLRENTKFISDMDGFGATDLPRAIAAYKARPLAGIWATPPFLHNGSVPSLYELLLPVDQRPKKFFVGRHLFDPVRVGYSTQPLDKGGFWLDVNIKGNSNIGHEFRNGVAPYSPNAMSAYGVIGPELTDHQRMAIIEYLKVHQDGNEKLDNLAAYVDRVHACK